MEMSPLHPVIPAANLGETLNSNHDDQKASTVLPQHFDGEHACDKKGSKDAKIVTNLAPRNSNPLLPTGANFPMHTPASRTLTVPDADSGIEDEENSSSSSSFNQDRPTKSNRPKKEIEIDPTTRSSPSPPSSGPQEDTSSTPSADNQHHVINQLDLRKPEDPIKYSMDGVLQHNVLRLTHGSPPIRHSERLRKMAQEYADWLSEARIGEQIQKSKNFSEVGENILFVPYVCYLSAKQATLLWYRQLRNINMSEVAKENFSSISSFSQIIWAGCESVGIGVSFGKRGGCYVVANYEPKMNLSLHNFLSNVLPPKSLFSIREEQLEQWASLLLSYNSKLRSSSDQEFSPVNSQDSGTNRNKLAKHWDQAVAVEPTKQKILASIKPSQ